MLQVKEEKINTCQRWSVWGPLNRPFHDLDGFSRGIKEDVPEQQGRALRRDDSSIPLKNGEKNEKGPTDGGKASGEGSGLSMGDPCASFGRLPKPCSNG